MLEHLVSVRVAVTSMVLASLRRKAHPRHTAEMACISSPSVPFVDVV
jgi:hypothetical protein